MYIKIKMQETWKDIKGYEGFYQISNLGRVKSLKRKAKCRNGFRTVQERILKSCKDSSGYFGVPLIKDKHRFYRIGKLIVQHFISNPQNKPCVNHVDGNKQNDKIDNLEWCTYAENNKHAYKTGLKSNKGEKQSHHLLTEKEIRQIRSLKNRLSQKEIAMQYNVDASTISNIMTRKNWTHLN